MNFSNLKLPGTRQEHPLMNEHKKVIMQDKHNVIEVIIANYDKDGFTYCVAGHNCIIGEQSVHIEPTTANGLYKSERGAVICMLSYLAETFGNTWPEEVVRVLRLAIWEYRQTSFFDN